jgi:hypothetical protein
MKRFDRLERDLTVWFAETAAPRTPPYLDDILRQTAHRRQRPRWTFLERLLPMTATASFRAATGNVPWRALGVLAILLLVLVVGAVLIGSSQHRLPAPFGPARAGQITYAQDGDIWVVTPTTNERRAIVTGLDTDHDPQWSRDGTRIVFERWDGNSARLFTVKPDGSELKAITPNPVTITDDPDSPDYAFSPDGRYVLFVASDAIQIAASDGSGVRTVETPGMKVIEAAWRPPAGTQAAVISSDGAVYVVDVATGAIARTVVASAPDIAAGGLFWSPDGSLLGYSPWSAAPDVETYTVRAHIFDFSTEKDRLADPQSAEVFWDYLGPWSNDGRHLMIARGYSDESVDVTVAIIGADGTGPRVETVHGLPIVLACCATSEWAPDDQSILVSPMTGGNQAGSQLSIDPVTGKVTNVDGSVISDPAWQRLAR